MFWHVARCIASVMVAICKCNIVGALIVVVSELTISKVQPGNNFGYAYKYGQGLQQSNKQIYTMA
eukprot:3391014-Amphidinium_carterae.1